MYQLPLLWQECSFFEDILIQTKWWRVLTIIYWNETKETKIYCILVQKEQTSCIQVACTLFFMWPTSLLSDYYELWFSWDAYKLYIAPEPSSTNITKCIKTKTSSTKGHKYLFSMLQESYSMQIILSTQLSILHTFIFNSNIKATFLGATRNLEKPQCTNSSMQTVQQVSQPDHAKFNPSVYTYSSGMKSNSTSHQKGEHSWEREKKKINKLIN